MNWLKYVSVAVGVLVANEIILSLMINRKHTHNLTSEEQANLSDERAFSSKAKAFSHAAKDFSTNATAPSAMVTSPNATAISALGIDVGGHDQLKNACISFNDEHKAHSISCRGVYGSWDARTKDRHERESLHMASRKNPWLRTSVLNKETGENYTSDHSSRLMFVPAMFDPSHCIQDLLFSLLPMAWRGELRGFQAVAVTRPNWSLPDWSGEKFPGYVGDYCTLALREMGWFQDVVLLPNNTCLDDIWVSTLMYHRFPRSRSRGTRSGNDYIGDEDLPLPLIHFFRQQMWRSFLADNEFLHKGRKARIVFDGRAELARGEWSNAHAVANTIREKLDPEVFEVKVVDNIHALAIKEQAALFHSASILVAPQGGSIANVVFMKLHAILLELSCGETSWVRDWVTDLKIRHSAIRADVTACQVKGQESFFAPPAILVDLILDICWQGQKK